MRARAHTHICADTARSTTIITDSHSTALENSESQLASDFDSQAVREGAPAPTDWTTTVHEAVPVQGASMTTRIRRSKRHPLGSDGKRLSRKPRPLGLDGKPISHKPHSISFSGKRLPRKSRVIGPSGIRELTAPRFAATCCQS
jgi:hypothetical protein